MLVHVSFMLPYLLRLPSGPYSTGAEGGTVYLREEYVAQQNTKRTTVSSEFDAPAALELERHLALQNREATLLLSRTNRLLRWYRAEAQQSSVVELTKSQASPFVFVETGSQSRWAEDLRFEADPPILPAVRSRGSLARAVKNGLAGKNDPEVSRLFLLDAEQARRDGRFRECVLFCWSTIDATFNTKYEKIVDEALSGEWAAGRESLKDTRFGMKNKMTAVLFLMTGRSLARADGDLWQKLDGSYKKRNSIIHRGETAQEADAEAALTVARAVVALMGSLKTRTPSKK